MFYFLRRAALQVMLFFFKVKIFFPQKSKHKICRDKPDSSPSAILCLMYQAESCFLRLRAPVLPAPVFQGNLLSPDRIIPLFPVGQEEEDVCMLKSSSAFKCRTFAHRVTLALTTPWESAATFQTEFGGPSRPLGTLASKAPLITNSAPANRLEP